MSVFFPRSKRLPLEQNLRSFLCSGPLTQSILEVYFYIFDFYISGNQGVKHRLTGTEMNSSLRKEGLKFDEAHSSLLKRANQTCDQILTELGQPEIPVHHHWRLNERHYGQDS